MNIMKLFVLSLAVHIIAVLTAQAQIEIRTAAEIASIGKDKNSIKGSYILMNDLTLEEWTPIVFSGTFNGNGHTITLNIESKEMADGKMKAMASAVATGLFREILTSGTVMNLHVTGSINFQGNYFIVAAGGIAGINSGKIMNCISSVNVTGKGIDQPRGRMEIGVTVGGSRTTAIYPYDGGTLVGGIAGINEGEISNCYATGNIEVSGNGDKIGGGIAGGNGKNMIMGLGGPLGDGIYKCYATGNIHVHDDNNSRIAGGITGLNICRLENSVALNSRIEVSGKSENKRLGNNRFGVGGNYTIANGLRGRSYDKHVKSQNCYYRSDMDVNIEKPNDTEKQELETPEGTAVSPTDTKQQTWWENSAKFAFGQSYEKSWIWDEVQQRPILYWEKFDVTIPDPNTEYAKYATSDEPSPFEGTYKTKNGKIVFVFKGNQFQFTAPMIFHTGIFEYDETKIILYIKKTGKKQNQIEYDEDLEYKFNNGILEITKKGKGLGSLFPSAVKDKYYKN